MEYVVQALKVLRNLVHARCEMNMGFEMNMGCEKTGFYFFA